MIGTLIAINVTLGKAGIALLLASTINAINAERTRQFELVREMGTLACQIENRRLLGQDCSSHRALYAELARLRK